MAVEMFDYLDDIIALETSSKWRRMILEMAVHSITVFRKFSFQCDNHIPCEFDDIGWPVSVVAADSAHPGLKSTVRFPS